MKKNKVYVLREHSHITETIITFTGYQDWPLTEKAHGILDELEKITDLHFVFTNASKNGIHPGKFSELYQATGFSLSEDHTGISGILRAIEYDREFWPGQHLYWNVIRGELLDEVDVEGVKRIIESSEVLKRSVFKTYRYTSEDLYEFYKSTDYSWKLWNIDILKNTYTTHTVSSECSWIVLKPELIDKIWEHIEKYPGYPDTFGSAWDFFGSVAIRLRDPELILNQDPQDVKINSNRK